MNNIQNLQLPDFSDLHLLVVGDVMIDRYITGNISRISPEAPVPILELGTSENRMGGAANVALNLSALGASVTLLSIIGDDEEGKLMEGMFSSYSNIDQVFLTITGRKTTVKTRIMSSNQHILRIDNENTDEITLDYQKRVTELFSKIIRDSKIDGVILQDYNKGLMTEGVIKNIIRISNDKQIPTFVDPKFKNFFAYQNCTFFKPNQKEISIALGPNSFSLDQIDEKLRQMLNHKITFITLGGTGIYTNDGIKSNIFSVKNRTISDVCGAGDTVISTASLCYLKNLTIDQIAIISNIAGGQVCEKPGVVSVDKEDLNKEIKNEKHTRL